MDLSYNGIPKKFVDPIFNEFVYDPIRLPITEDPAQLLYNRRTLERIWDAKHDAINPHTRQPFDIRNAIPQIELRQQMLQYILENSTNSLEVISVDYTKPLNSADMKHMLSELVIAGENFLLASENWSSNESKASCKSLWQKLNLLRLCCQYNAENRETFLSVNGYKFLLSVMSRRLYLLYPSNEDTKEACKEVVKIVDVVGLKAIHLQLAPEANVNSLIEILHDHSKCQLLKIQTTVLRIYRRLYQDWVLFPGLLPLSFSKFSYISLRSALYLLDHGRNSKYISNEDLYNGTAILEFDWTRHNGCGDELYVHALVNVVIKCISRFENLHATATHRAQAQDDHEHEKEKNIDLISKALDQALFLVHRIVRPDEEDRSRVLPERRHTLKQRVQMLDIVDDIVKMVELVLAGIKFFQSSHLGLGLTITAILCQEDRVSERTRRHVVKVFEDFLGSHIVDEYHSQIKLLLQYIVGNNAS